MRLLEVGNYRSSISESIFHEYMTLYTRTLREQLFAMDNYAYEHSMEVR